MQYLIGAGIAGILLYFLSIGGVLIWPLVNILAYSKVLFFPRPIRRKYGSIVTAVSKHSFDQEITADDEKQIAKLAAEKKTLMNKLQKLKNDLAALGELKRNKDGSISQRSNKGKEAQRLTDLVPYVASQISDIDNTGWPLENKPYLAWSDWSARFGRYLGNRDSIIFMIVGFPLFFAILSNFNLLELPNATFKNVAEIYVYIVFVAPMIDFFGASFFSEGVTTLFISYDYAVYLAEEYDSVFTFYNWLIVALPMPLATLLVYYTSKSIHINKTNSVQPDLRVQFNSA